jgi:X-Pro dipeptidyl-peptidase C-terminal non-catalytic domain
MRTELLARSDRQQLNESRDFLDSEQNLANSPMVIFSRQRVGSRSKAICGRVYIARFLFAHPAHGWLRLSHRELDASRSKPYQPIYSHQREQRLKAGKIVPVEIEIWPSSTIFRAGEQIRLLVMGKDPFPPSDGPGTGIAIHPETRNLGGHIIHARGRFRQPAARTCHPGQMSMRSLIVRIVMPYSSLRVPLVISLVSEMDVGK